MNKKILTVSVAAYNVEKYLKRTLESLIVPEIMDKLEVLIVDDGSTDKTGEIAEKYVEKYPYTFIHIKKENGGWGSTINASIKVATGKYYKVLDGDDWFETDAIKEFIEKLERTDVDLVFNLYTKVYEFENRKELIELPYPYNREFKVNEIKAYSMPALTIKTDLIKNDKFHISENCFYTDVEYCVKCYALSENVYCLPINIYQYRLGRIEQSVSIESMLKRVSEHEKIVRTVLPIVYNEKKLQNLQKDINFLAVRHFNLLLCVKPNKEHRQMVNAYIKTIRQCYPQIIQSIPKYQRFAFYCPIVFYRITVKIKRRKNGFK